MTLLYTLYLKCLVKFQECFFPQKKENIHINACQQTSGFRDTIQQFVALTAVEFYLWRHWKSLLYSAVNRDFTNTFFMTVRQFATSPNPLKLCDFPWSDLSMSAWFRLRIFLIFIVNCDLINNTNSTVIKLETSISNVLSQLLLKTLHN